MYSSGLPRYHPLHDPELQKPAAPRPRPAAARCAALPALLDPRLYRSYTGHALCAAAHLALMAVAVRGWSLCGEDTSDAGCAADLARLDVPFGASAVAGIVAAVHCFLFMLTVSLESSISLPLRDLSPARYAVHYAAAVFGCGSAIVDFKYALRAAIHAGGWRHMQALEATAAIACAFTLFAVAVDGFKIYYAWNTAAQINAAIPKIKVEDMSTDSKEAMR